MTAVGIIGAMAVAVPTDPLHAALRDRFGHGDFREGQREVVDAVLAGDDVILVMPTGGGKSLCYQLPAVLEQQTTVVISPLIALMKDQIDALTARGIAAGALHSNLPQSAQRVVESAYRSGVLRLLYVAPERLVRPDFKTMLAETPPRRLVVDEAHCISEWGHDFRRDYLRIGDVASALAPLQIVACTATATVEVREDIAGRLGQRRPRSFVHGFARPNLRLAAERLRSEADKLSRLDEVIDPGDGHVIVYAGTRARAATLAARIAIRYPTMLYHADLGADERSRAQERFRSGEVRIAVTTSAFGMGVDIPSVRQVIHAALPASLEEYYQQAGRAGRDGLPATCLVLYTAADRRLPEFFIESSSPEPPTIAGVYRSLRSGGGIDPGAWSMVGAPDAAVAAISDAAGDAARAVLRDAGVIDPSGRIADCDPRRLPVDHGRIATHRRLAFRRLDTFFAYLAGRECRHRFITRHFGEEGAGQACGSGCDVCAPRRRDPSGDPVDAVDDTTVRRALSAVARLNGRVGLVRLAGVLVGSRSRSVAAVPGGTDIPTYGAMQGWREADVVELLRRLTDAGALQLSPPPYPTVSITQLGVEAMRGVQALRVADPRRRSLSVRGHPHDTRAGAGTRDLSDDEARRFAHLRAWRTRRARERDVPAYVVLPDRTLVELAAAVPATLDALATVPGIGPAKLALYGSDLLETLSTMSAPETVP
jgi:ATP-dependent DNA helicase RecQ